MKTSINCINQTIGMALFIPVCMWLSGCATPPPSANVKPLTANESALDLSKYHVATIVPFESHNEEVKDPSIGETFAKDIAWRLKNSYGPIFSEVDQGSLRNRTDELIVTGKFTKYNPGSRDVRNLAGIFGLGAASLDGSLILKDGSDQHIIYEGEFSKLWAWGGAMGAVRGIEDMEAATVALVANTIALGKGWKPPVPNGNSHPKYSDYRASLPPLTTNQARIWFYRPSSMVGAAVLFTIKLDGAYVGTSVNGGFFCVNVAPGTHKITDVVPAKTTYGDVSVTDGSEAYVFVRWKPEQVSDSRGIKEIEGLHLKGN
ncbi:MAG TPA: DUF2846 domain-containing protein [Candidatus Baltobacteraceae bacterium]|nr:DUF2846 domain-containing protein [Candidatus Baltobacteraceae bacterium]